MRRRFFTLGESSLNGLDHTAASRRCGEGKSSQEVQELFSRACFNAIPSATDWKGSHGPFFIHSFIHSLNTNFGTSIFEPIAKEMGEPRFRAVSTQAVAGRQISAKAHVEI
jgi:Type II restriction endonuclease, TdeIII